MTESMTLHHSVDAKHAQNIGEQSVSDRVQAVIEIVKNSYDGDATNCRVKFFARSGGSGTLVHVDHIEISDDGIGMTLDDIENKWMRLATGSKVEKPASPKFGRKVSGKKGMGHFATQKLGSKITIISCPEMYNGRSGPDESNKTFVLLTDWEEYVPGKSFHEIGNKLVIEPRDSERAKDMHQYKQGITIVIRNLKEDWTTDDVERLRRHLSSLQSPKWLRGDIKDPFDIEVESHGFDIAAKRKRRTFPTSPPGPSRHISGEKKSSIISRSWTTKRWKSQQRRMYAKRSSQGVQYQQAPKVMAPKNAATLTCTFTCILGEEMCTKDFWR